MIVGSKFVKSKRIDEEKFEEFFCYSMKEKDDNYNDRNNMNILTKEKVVKGILFYSLADCHQKADLLAEYKKPREQKIEELIEEAMNAYRQYYKFIILPDDSMQYNSSITRQKEEELRLQLRTAILEAEKKEELIFYPAGIYFSAIEEKNFNETNGYIKKTQECYAMLRQLEALEKKDPIAYTGKWIEMKLKRAEKKENREESEVEAIRYLRDRFEQRKQEIKQQNEECLEI